MNIKRRSIPITILLSLVTCGIYGIYWFYCMTNEAAQISEECSGMTGGKAILYSIITCGIYSIYWCYKMGLAVSESKRKRGLTAENNGILFLVLAIFGLGIVDYCILQDELNKWAEE